MREFAREVYLSQQWKRVRAYIFRREDGICQRCGKPGNTVHHKTYLTPRNVNDSDVVYGEDNLELLCEQCHGQEHESKSAAGEGFAFDADGNLIRKGERDALQD